MEPMLLSRALDVELVRLMRWSGAAPKVLAEHTAAEDGRCPVCRTGGDGGSRVVAPCRLYLLARRATAPVPSPRRAG